MKCDCVERYGNTAGCVGDFAYSVLRLVAPVVKFVVSLENCCAQLAQVLDEDALL